MARRQDKEYLRREREEREALLSRAYIAYRNDNDLVAALELYRSVCERWPASEDAKLSEVRIGHIEKNPKLAQQIEAPRQAEHQAELGKQQRRETQKIEQHGDAFLYEKFMAEVEGVTRDHAIWSKALTIHYGDETKAKFEYVKIRVEDALQRLGLSMDTIPDAPAGQHTNDPPPAGQSQKAVNWYMVALAKYAVFEGRARRKEYWYFLLFNSLVVVFFGILDMVAGTFDHEVGIGPISGLYALATIIPSISVTVRRLHDTDRSGWWWWLTLIPLINFVLLAFMIFDGTPGPNRYGPDPKSSSP